MSMPLHPELTFADSRAISEAGLRHTAQLGTVTTVRQPNGEEVQTWTFSDPIPCRMKVIGTRQAQIAAAQGVKAQWSLVFKSNQTIGIGQKVVVSGERDGVIWARTVEITADLGLTGRVHRQTTAIDVELNQ
jgi:hypothetical protein